MPCFMYAMLQKQASLRKKVIKSLLTFNISVPLYIDIKTVPIYYNYIGTDKKRMEGMTDDK